VEEANNIAYYDSKFFIVLGENGGKAFPEQNTLAYRGEL
jgi:hypothetical protein